MVLALSFLRKYFCIHNFPDFQIKQFFKKPKKTRDNIHRPKSLSQRSVEFVENLWNLEMKRLRWQGTRTEKKKARIVSPIDLRSKSLIRFVSVFNVHQKIVNSIKFLTCTVDFRHRIKFVEIDLGWFSNSTVKCQVV